MNTVLVIDDNADYRAGLIELLEFQSYITLEAENGLIGLQTIRQYSPNLIVCDVDMPVMDGMEVLKSIKADPIFAKIPFVMVTGCDNQLTLKASRDLGVEAYLTKPVAIPEFLSTISHFLQVSVL